MKLNFAEDEVEHHQLYPRGPESREMWVIAGAGYACMNLGKEHVNVERALISDARLSAGD